MRRLLTGVACAVLVASIPQPALADQSFSSAVFRATHNSYSGNVSGTRGSITYQLSQGVRFLELDIHDNGYATTKDYGVGHDSPGNQVDHNGNPSSNALSDWLTVIDGWSKNNPSHAPIVVMLDLKDDLTDNPSFAAGNLAAINKEVTDVFGTSLVQAGDFPAGLPSVDALRGRVLTLLSGHASTRAHYRRDLGYSPAVAVNRHGQIVEVHDSGNGTLWYWTGTYNPDGSVTWARHGRYDTGKTPSVALNDDGWIVEVHQSQNNTTLWSHVGRLGADGEITWSPSQEVGVGVTPTVAFTDPAGTTVREVHRSQSNSQNWEWRGAVNTGNSTMTWSGNAKTSDALYDKATATRGTMRVSVSTGADNGSPAETLRYSTDQGASGRIRYPQTAFVEYQAGDSAELQQGALFYAATASNKSFITSARNNGRIVRGWDFDSAGQATTPLANYPATNQPWASWYSTLLTQAGAVQ
ncbi:hypothetical protein JOF56_007225 [Kibdelosporangium banguiense]|uniref:Phosphoinositide phospholipase C, Ca2+-dependent n=1 Tax=Kibdelosporangium banguiense TaxID=1365924 RepID=A0ABS4TSB4_9PSEU|nr:hypothetical protein [Kibdelosporangium banguiense]MBP2326840.1 hypothetical protein [Kibdelosporangium banguiense]